MSYPDTCLGRNGTLSSQIYTYRDHRRDRILGSTGHRSCKSLHDIFPCKHCRISLGVCLCTLRNWTRQHWMTIVSCIRYRVRCSRWGCRQEDLTQSLVVSSSRRRCRRVESSWSRRHRRRQDCLRGLPISDCRRCRRQSTGHRWLLRCSRRTSKIRPCHRSNNLWEVQGILSYPGSIRLIYRPGWG